MAAINFPNPSTQTPANVFGPDSAPSSTSNGLTYLWNGVGWRMGPSSSSNNFLSLAADAGDQIVESINLTLFSGNTLVGGTTTAPNITLKASDGSANFEGSVVVNSNSGGTPKTKLWSDGSASLAEGQISLNSDGSAVFAGDVKSGANPGTTTSDTSGAFLYGTSGSITAIKDSTETGPFFSGAKYNDDVTERFKFMVHNDGQVVINPASNSQTASANIKLNADGSATFGSGNAVIGSDGSLYSAAYLQCGPGVVGTGAGVVLCSGGNSFIGYQNTAITATISEGGNATFAGDVNGRVFIAKTENDTFGTYITRNTANQNTAVIYQNGSADFGNLVIGGTTNLGTTKGIYLRYPQDSANSARTAFEVTASVSGVETGVCSIYGDGSASFAGQTLSSSGVAGVRDEASDVKTVWRGFGGSSLTSQIFADGHATFNGTVTASNFVGSGGAPVGGAFASAFVVNNSVAASSGMSSVTASGNGRYLFNLSTAAPNANYTAVGNCSSQNNGSMLTLNVSANVAYTQTTTQFQMTACTDNGQNSDQAQLAVAVFLN